MNIITILILFSVFFLCIDAEDVVCQVESNTMIKCGNSTYVLEEKDKVGSFMFYIDLGVVVFCILLGGEKKSSKKKKMK